MASSRYSTGLPGQSDARRQLVRQSPTSASPSEPEFTRARSNWSAPTFEALRSTKPPASQVQRRQVKSSSPRPQNFCWPVRGSHSNPQGSISSKASAKPASYSDLPAPGDDISQET